MKKLMSLTLIAIIIFTLILPVGSNFHPRVEFKSVEELLAYEFDAHEWALSSSDFDLITQKNMCVAPVLPEEYGKYMIQAEGGMTYFYYYDNSAPKIKEFEEQYGEFGYVQISIPQTMMPSFITLGEIIEKQRASYDQGTNPNKGEFVFGYAESNGIEFAYICTNGVGITGMPFSNTYIYTFLEGNHYMPNYISIRLPFSDEETALKFIEEIEFKTFTIPRTIKITSNLTGVTAVMRSVTSLFLKVGTIVSDFNMSELTIEVNEILPGGVTDDVDVLFGEIVDFFKSK